MDAADRERRFFAMASRVLGTPDETLSFATRKDSVPSWDSIAHLRLVMEGEALSGNRLSIESIPGISSLGELYGLLFP